MLKNCDDDDDLFSDYDRDEDKGNERLLRQKLFNERFQW